jgi:hypothetical protein
MQRPRSTSGGPAETRARASVRLGGTTETFITPAGPPDKFNNAGRAARFDRWADLLLFTGEHHAAERLSNLAAALRAVAT